MSDMNPPVRVVTIDSLEERIVSMMLDRLEELRARGITFRTWDEAGRLLVREGYSAADLRLFFEHVDRARALIETAKIKFVGRNAPSIANGTSGERSDRFGISPVAPRRARR